MARSVSHNLLENVTITLLPNNIGVTVDDLFSLQLRRDHGHGRKRSLFLFIFANVKKESSQWQAASNG